MKKKTPIYSKKQIKTQNLKIFLYACIFVILILLIIFVSKMGLLVPLFPNLGNENLAVGKIIHSSSYLNTTNSASQAIDGNQSTVWESNHILPAYITIDLVDPYVINQIILKLPILWGAKKETVELLGSLDNTTFTQIVPPTSYSMSPTATINLPPKIVYRYLRLQISKNSQTNSAQLGEFEIYGSKPQPPWAIQSIDVMKYTKDVVCNVPSLNTINTMNDRIATSGANFVAIDTPYDSPSCGSSIKLTNDWITSARARNLHIWHRHMGLAFEGFDGVAKTKDLAAYTKQIVDYINNNPDQFQDGDIFTPTAEPDTAGIFGVTYCPTICQFSGATEFNSWIQTTQTAVKAAFATLGKNVKVGYYGFSSFIVWGENNPDWIGKSFLTQATIDSMDGVIATDTYPEAYGGNMVTSLNGIHTKWPNARILVGEWGTTTISSDSAKVEAVKSSMSAAEVPYVDGFNYWNLGPSGNEGLLDNSLNPKPAFQTVKEFYTGLR